MTGLDEKKDSLLSIGAVNMVNGRIELGTTFYQLVKPRSFKDVESVIIHEITPSEVTQQPEVGPVLADFLNYINGRVLAGYYLTIDLGFLNREMRRIYDRPWTTRPSTPIGFINGCTRNNRRCLPLPFRRKNWIYTPWPRPSTSLFPASTTPWRMP